MPTPRLALPYIAQGQAQKEVTHNDALVRLDALVDLYILDRDFADPPASPADGDAYIVAASPTGAWAGQAGNVAYCIDGAWRFYVPVKGLVAYVADEQKMLVFTASGWVDLVSLLSLQNLALLGIGTTADAGNPFAAKLNNVLWAANTVAEGGNGDLRYKLNKESAGNTLSLLMQSGWSGRAEIGLTGDDDLHFKVSPDGANFIEAASVDHVTGDFAIGGWRVSRDAVMNVLPDSGRFNGNANNMAFSGITYTAPSYLTAVSGGSIASYAKFIHGNNDYGGSAGALDPVVKELVDKIRDPLARAYGPEWYVVLVTQTSGALSEPVTVNGQSYGMPFSNTFTALPKKYTAGFYVRCASGSIAINVPALPNNRGTIDGVLCPQVAVLSSADGWKYVNLQSAPNAYGYNYRAFDVIATAGSTFYFAMPRFVFGHVDIDPNLGVLMNGKMFG